MKLPSLKVTQRSTGKGKRSVVYARGPDSSSSGVNEEYAVSAESPTSSPGHPFLPDLPDLTDGEEDKHSDVRPTLHEIKQAANAEAWKSIRHDILHAVTELYAMPIEQHCTACCKANAIYRCIECGPSAYYCPQCLWNSHSKTNIFHTPEVWDVSLLKWASFYSLILSIYQLIGKHVQAC